MMAQERETGRWALPGTLSDPWPLYVTAGYQEPGGRCVCGVRQVCLATPVGSLRSVVWECGGQPGIVVEGMMSPEDVLVLVSRA